MRIILRILMMLRNVILNLVFALISLFIKRDDNLWVVGGWFGQRFADNSSYFFSYLVKKTNYRAIWISKRQEIVKSLRKQGLEAYRHWDLRGIALSLKAKYHVIDQAPSDINPFTSFGATKLNLWHGFPLKRIGTLTVSRKNGISQLREHLRRFTLISGIAALRSNGASWRNSFLLCTSDLSCDIYEKAFRKKREKIIKSNYPRIEFMLGNIESISCDYAQKEILRKISKMKDQGYRIVSYFPTFRDTGQDSFFGTTSTREIGIFFEELSKEKIGIVCKLHHAVNIFGSNAANSIPDNLNNLIMLDEKMDVYPFLKLSDVLVTDYSSVYFDFLWLDRPVVFYPYDLEYFKSSDRGLIFDYEEMTPGPKAYTIQDLLILLSKAINEPAARQSYADKRRKVREVAFEDVAGCEKIIEDLVLHSRNND